MLKIFQARLQQYVNCELPDIQAGFRKGRGTRGQIAKICWVIEKAREFQKNIYFCFIDYAKAFDCVDHNKLWKILQDMGRIRLGHLICLLRNLYAGQETTPQGLSISENSHECLHLYTRPSISQQPVVPIAGCLTQTISKTNPISSRQDSQWTPQNTTSPSPAHWRKKEKKAHLLPQKHKHNSLATQSLHQQWDQIYTPRAENETKGGSSTILISGERRPETQVGKKRKQRKAV